MEKTSRFPLWAKIICIILVVIIAFAAVVGVTFVGIWGNEIATVSSITFLRDRNDANKEGEVYSMRVKGGFYFDKFLEQGGVSNDKELISFITNNITKGLLDMGINESDVNCSAFNCKTPEGDVLFARNYDFKQTNVCMTITDNPGEGRYRSFSTVDLNYVGIAPDESVSGLMDKITCLAAPFAPLDGVNEKGLSCGIFMSYQGGTFDEGTVATDQQDANKDNVTSTTMLRLILDYAANVDEAVELISNYNLHDSAKSSFHYMIADADGKSALLEWVPENGTDATDNDGAARVLKVTYNTDEMYSSLRDSGDFKYQWITNFIVSNHDEYYTDNDAKPGWDRYEDIYNTLHTNHGVVENEQAAMNILRSVGRRTYKGGGGCTVHSVVFNLTKKSVLWVANENYDDASAYYTFDFETGVLKQANA